jgi:hypothetical protein
VPVGVVAGIAAMARASHERLRQRMEALEQRVAQAEWRGAAGSTAPGEFRKALVCSPARVFMRRVANAV